MTVYVDPAIHPWKGKLWCHLFSEDLKELHAFARRLGLKRSWFQQPPRASWEHYDITANKRLEAVRMGAQEVDFWKAIEVARGKTFVKKLKRRSRLRLRSMRADEGE